MKTFEKWMLLGIFGTAIFSSSLLLFLIEPLVGKVFLPKLGGTPQVWNTCMVFFQTIVFAGYLYAHFISSAFRARTQVFIHLALVAVALLTVPVGATNLAKPPDDINPVSWLLWSLMATVAAPVFVISCTAPLLQKWFSYTRSPYARDPYFLYATSNLGSLVALLGYPTLVEPFLGLGNQAFLWSIGFALFVCAVAVCGLSVCRDALSPKDDATSPRDVVAPIAATTRLRWFLLSFAPASLLLGVTTYITTDIAAVPLLWIVPLGLYLLTFVLAFSQRSIIPYELMLKAQTVLLILVAVLVWTNLGRQWIGLSIHLLAFFVTALVCHGELAKSRPATHHLTGFYLLVSAGGVVGGMFNALIAPVVFHDLFEYPLMLVAACLLRPAPQAGTRRDMAVDIVAPIGLGILLLVCMKVLESLKISNSSLFLYGAIGLIIVVASGLLSLSSRPIRFGLSLAMPLLIFSSLSGLPVPQLGDTPGKQLLTMRSFFGVSKIYQDETVTQLVHGSTVHGAQFRDQSKVCEPASYYHSHGPFGDLFTAFNGRSQNGRVAVLGLGAGGLAAYASPTSRWTYYEIDPLVKQIARDNRFFSYLAHCAAHVEILLGDGRLKLQEAAARSYDLIIVDVFSADAIPTHLLTLEAMQDYLEKLAPHGIVAVHISNNYIDLAPVIGNLARTMGLVGRINSLAATVEPIEANVAARPAKLAVLARHDSDFGSIAQNPKWKPLALSGHSQVWTDDYVNLLEVMVSRGKFD